MIYLDSSAALAHLLAEDRFPPHLATALQACLPNAPSKRSLENNQSRLHDQSKREQRFEPGSYFVKHACGSLGYKPRPSLLPRGTAQLIGLYNAADLVAVWYRDMKAPITITPPPTGQFIKGPRGKHERRAPPGLLVGDRLQEIEPNNIACIGAVGTSPCLIAALRAQIDLLRNVVSGHSAQQFIERVTRLTCWLEDGAQHQCSVLDVYFSLLAVADFERIRNRLWYAYGKAITPTAKFDYHACSL